MNEATPAASALTLVVGATGKTGRLLVQELLNRGQRMRAIVRSPESLSTDLRAHERLVLVQGTVLDLSDAELAEHVVGCNAIASCLGHTLSFKGIFGKPRRLVTDSVRRLCETVESVGGAGPVKFVLMNTTGNRNRDLDERVSFAERCALGLLRVLVPPHADNEQAADYLRCRVGKDHPAIEWAAVRPDGLIDEDAVSPTEVHPSPQTSALFAPGKTSRINVASFMAELIASPEIWSRWKGRMPVIYNGDSDAPPPAEN